jgi:hypothetical protein
LREISIQQIHRLSTFSIIFGKVWIVCVLVAFFLRSCTELCKWIFWSIQKTLKICIANCTLQGRTRLGRYISVSSLLMSLRRYFFAWNLSNK